MITAEQLVDQLQRTHGLHVASVDRIAAGSQTDNFHIVCDDGQHRFVKVYRPATKLADDVRDIAAARHASSWNVPVPALLRTLDGHVIGGDDRRVSVWEWIVSDDVHRSRTAATAHHTGAILARLHRAMRHWPTSRWPPHAAKFRTVSVTQAQQHVDELLTHIAGLPAACADDIINADRLAERRRQLAHLPALRAALPAPDVQGLHGDFTRPNVLTRNGDVAAIIDFRTRVGDPAWELGRIAFDSRTVATTDDWLDIAVGTLTGYLDEGGHLTPQQTRSVARLELMHTLTSLYGVQDRYLRPGPLRADLDAYWARRTVAATRMLDSLDAIDDAVTATVRSRKQPARPRPPAGTGTRRPGVIVLVTGVSGAGKTTLAKHLQSRRHSALSLDGIPDLCRWTDTGGNIVRRPAEPDLDWLRVHRWVWQADTFAGLVTDARAMGGTWYLCGTAANQKELFALCDTVVWLDIDRATMRTRVTQPTRTNPHGTIGDTLAHLTESFDPGPPNGIDVIIDARKDIDTIADQILTITCLRGADDS